MKSLNIHSRPLLLLITISCAAIILLAAWAWPSYRLHSLRARALHLSAHGHSAAAEPLLHEALQGRGDDLEVLQALALAQLEANKLSELDETLTRCCELRPDDPEPLKRLFELRLRLGRREQAIADGQRLLKLEPGSAAF